jgi:hypothetical protein
MENQIIYENNLLKEYISFGLKAITKGFGCYCMYSLGDYAGDYPSFQYHTQELLSFFDLNLSEKKSGDLLKIFGGILGYYNSGILVNKKDNSIEGIAIVPFEISKEKEYNSRAGTRLETRISNSEYIFSIGPMMNKRY